MIYRYTEDVLGLGMNRKGGCQAAIPNAFSLGSAKGFAAQTVPGLVVGSSSIYSSFRGQGGEGSVIVILALLCPGTVRYSRLMYIPHLALELGSFL